MRRSVVAAVVLVLAVLAAACGGDGAEDPAADVIEGEGGIAALLNLVPDAEGASQFVVVNDVTAAREAAAIERPEPGADELELGRYFVSLSTDPDSGLGTAPNQLLQTALQDEEWRDELGFAPLDIDGDVAAGLPPDQYQAFVGAFDPEAVEEAVERDPVWSDALEVDEHRGVSYFSWGDDDAIDPERISTVRQLGESLRLFVDDNLAYVARSSDVIRENLDTLAGASPSLADDDRLGPMAAALDDLEAYSAVLITDTAQFAGAGGAGPALEPYRAVATGAALVDREARLLIVLSNEDEATAEENAERLADVVAQGESALNGRPWSDALDEGTIETDGVLTIASFPTDDPRLWNGVVLTRDSLLATS